MLEVKKETSSANPEGVTKPVLSSPADSFTLAHISDLHLTSLKNITIRQLLNKRMLGYLSWRRKRRIVHRLDIVEALLEDLKTAQPDHIAVTGDLTHLGLPGEFAEAGQWLTRLGPPNHVTVIPGNHEAYVDPKWSNQLSAWEPYLSSDNRPAGCRNIDFFPSLRVRGSVALIGLSSATPSLPFLAIGSLGKKQLDGLSTLLQTTGEAGLLRIVLIHHPPVQGTINRRKRLVDSRAFAEIFARYGAELVLHGHTHTPTFAELQTPAGKVPVVGAPSASEMNPHKERSAKYNLYVIKRNGENWDLKMLVRSFSESSGKFDEEQETTLILP
jgi:3',5'-cyclic AMP phosphodiesterase CpdA